MSYKSTSRAILVMLSSDGAVRIYEMGYTAREFENTLKGDFTGPAAPFSCIDLGQNHWRVKWHDQPDFVDINISPRPARKLGAMAIPVLQVHFETRSASSASERHFFDKFFKYFHKGGG